MAPISAPSARRPRLPGVDLARRLGACGATLGLAAPLSGADWRERLGLTGPQVAAGGIWLRAASVGELTSAQVLAQALARDFPLVVTTNSLTGRDLARRLGFACALAPLDVPQAVRRFLDRVRPAVMVTVENELWPNRSAIAAARAWRRSWWARGCRNARPPAGRGCRG